MFAPFVFRDCDGVGQSGGEFVDDEGSVEAGTRLFGIMFRSQIAIRSTLWRPGSTPTETVTIAAGRRGVGGTRGVGRSRTCHHYGALARPTRPRGRNAPPDPPGGDHKSGIESYYLLRL